MVYAIRTDRRVSSWRILNLEFVVMDWGFIPLNDFLQSWVAFRTCWMFEIWSTFLAVVLDMLVNLTPKLPGWTVGSYNPRIASPAGGWCRGTSWQVLAREICGSRRGQQGGIIRVYSCDSSLVPGYSWTSHTNCSPINDTFSEAKSGSITL